MRSAPGLFVWNEHAVFLLKRLKHSISARKHTQYFNHSLCELCASSVLSAVKPTQQL
ncbi:MAG: hypothetical protein JWP12_3880 [Bacteroidetes bacterium]|nr:hypothetical protein [Bacteroidota bacterium]